MPPASIFQKKIKEVKIKPKVNEIKIQHEVSETNTDQAVFEQMANEDVNLENNTEPTSENREESTETKPNRRFRKLADRNFHPIEDSPIGKGENITIGLLAQAVEEIEKNSQGQDTLKEILANLFRVAIVNNPNELRIMFYLLNWKLGPEYYGIETGVGNEQLVQSIARAWATTPKTVKDALKRLGDLGSATMELKGTMKNLQWFFSAKTGDIKPLTIERSENYNIVKTLFLI